MLIMFLLLLSHHLSGVAEAQVHFFVADNMLHTLLSLLMLSCSVDTLLVSSDAIFYSLAMVRCLY